MGSGTLWPVISVAVKTGIDWRSTLKRLYEFRIPYVENEIIITMFDRNNLTIIYSYDKNTTKLIRDWFGPTWLWVMNINAASIFFFFLIYEYEYEYACLLLNTLQQQLSIIEVIDFSSDHCNIQSKNVKPKYSRLWFLVIKRFPNSMNFNKHDRINRIKYKNLP